MRPLQFGIDADSLRASTGDPLSPKPTNMTSSDNTPPGLFAWGRYRLPQAEPLRVHLGFLAIFARREGDEIRLSHQQVTEEGTAPSMPDDPAAWSRWSGSESPGEIEIRPAFPDRPLVLRPENPFNLLPEARARVFVRVPVWVRVEVPGDRGGLLMEIPTQTLSDTWWGTPTEGQGCYWLDILARRGAASEVFSPDRILCPLELSNRAREELPVEKILLRVEHLSIFRGPGSLWSDEVRIHYRGEAEGSHLEMTGRTPPEAPGATRMAPPRIPMVKGLTARTFSRLKALPGLGSSL